VGIDRKYFVSLVVLIAVCFSGLLVFTWFRARTGVDDPVFRAHFQQIQQDEVEFQFEVPNEFGQLARIGVPRDIVQAHIVGHLDVRSLGRASQLNRSWNRVGVEEIRARLTKVGRLGDWRAVARDARSALPSIRSELHSRRKSLLLFVLLPLVLALLVIVTLHVDYGESGNDFNFNSANPSSLEEFIALILFLLIWRFVLWPLIKLVMSIFEPVLRFVAIVFFGQRFEDLEHKRTTSVLLGGSLMSSVFILLILYYVLLGVINWRRFVWERKKRILRSLQSDAVKRD
jgi:hypothetical protein